MEFDVISNVAAVERTLETVTRDGRPAKLVVAVRSYPTSVEDLWDALTSAERLPRWFAPVHGDLRLGGRFQVEGNAGGEVLACEPPHRFEISWEMHDDISWVEVLLSGAPDGSSARLELRHTASVPPEFWEQYGPGAVGVGWDLGLLGLALHVERGTAIDPASLETAPEVLEYSAAASERWGDAAVAGGEDPEWARAAAQRTAAFYTGAP